MSTTVATTTTTTTTAEPKKESLGISAALILSLVGLTLLLVIAVLIKREIRRGNVKSKRDGHFWTCKYCRKWADADIPKDGKLPEKVKPQWLLVGHHELPKHYYTKDECPQYIARMFTIDLYTVLQHTCRETFSDIDSSSSIEPYLINTYPSLNDTLYAFRRIKIRAEIDLVPFTIHDTKHAADMFNEILQKLSEHVPNPYLCRRQVHLPTRNEGQQIKMSSDYIPLLPKDLCHIPLRSIEDDSLGDLNKRSRSKGRFPFQLPSFLNKHRFFSSKSSAPSKNDISTDIRTSTGEVPGGNSNCKINRQLIKRQVPTDAIPLVQLHDTLSRSTSTTQSIDIERRS